MPPVPTVTLTLTLTLNLTLPLPLALIRALTLSLALALAKTPCQVPRHPSFRVFAAMNPPTDFGKKELPANPNPNPNAIPNPDPNPNPTPTPTPTPNPNPDPNQELPASIRSRMTELYVPSLSDPADLQLVVLQALLPEP